METNQRKLKIQSLLNRLEALQKRKKQGLSQTVQELLQEEAEGISMRSGASPTAKAITAITQELDLVKKDPRFDKITGQVKKAKDTSAKKLKELESSFSEKLAGLLSEVKGTEARGAQTTLDQAKGILQRLSDFKGEFENERQVLSNRDTLLESELARISQELAQVPGMFDETFLEIATEVSEVSADVQEAKNRATSFKKDLEKAIEEAEERLNSRINNRNNHGGNANRSIVVGGNPSTLGYFTDINFKAGSGVTITYQANQTTKYTDITISATGGGGSGITRQIQTVAVPTAMDGTAGIDQVYLASGTITLTLPTSVGNQNMYTVKNIGAGVVTINTTGGETIDGDPTVIMPIQFTSVDLISNNAGNWNIT